MNDLETLDYQEADGVALVTMRRPEVHNAFNSTMQRELRAVWRWLREHDDVRCVVLTGAGDRAFSTGIDRSEAMGHLEGEGGSSPVPGPGDVRVGQAGGSPLHYDGPASNVGPKSCQLWKPVIAAVNGMACGGAFFLLGEVEFIIAAEHATFFIPHLSAGMTSGFEGIELLHRAPFGEVARMVLLGNDERMSATRAHQIGLVTEVVPGDELVASAMTVARSIAEAPLEPLVASVRAMWLARDVPRQQAMELAPALMHAGNVGESLSAGQRAFAAGTRRTPRIR